MKTTIIEVLILLGIFLISNAATGKESLITNGNTYNRTKKTWEKAYRESTQLDNAPRGTTYISPIKGNGYPDRLHKNRARDTIIFVPEGINFNESIDVIFYFHGLGGFKKRDFGTRVLSHLKYFKEKKKNYLVVIPEMPWSRNTSTPRSRQGRVFNKKDQFATFTNSVIKVVVALFEPSVVKRSQCMEYNLCQFNFGNIILVGHSAGGSTLMSISKSGGLDWLYTRKRGGALSVKVIFSDAGYGRWTDITWKNFRLKGPNTHTKFILLTRKWDRPHKNTKRFLKRFKTIPNNIRHIVFDRKIVTHAGIGDQALKWAHLLDWSGCGEGK